MDALKINVEKIYDFVSKESVESYKEEIEQHIDSLDKKNGKGNNFLGWLNLPSGISDSELSDIEETAQKLRQDIDVLVVIGIGGSYLGAKSLIDALTNSFAHLQSNRSNPVVLFAGQNIGEDYLYELLDVLKEKSYAIVVISKSGTTTEPAIAFRLLKQDLENKIGKEKAKERIVAITDKSKGALHQMSILEEYKTFVIPDDIGGRYSVFTPVGLLPVSVSGINIRQLIEGAEFMEKSTDKSNGFHDNPAAIYAAARNTLYKTGKTTEILVNFVPKLHYIMEWWKQLYGESEGKEGKGIFPASVDFPTDLHSMGQYIQEGIRNIFETVISVKNTDNKLVIPSDDANLDKLNYIAGKRIDKVNKMAELGTMLAHVDGGVPNIRVEIPGLNEQSLGQLLYFFEKACAISGYILGINPFDQPGVEAYKRNMFALLEKPGFEEETKKIKERLG